MCKEHRLGIGNRIISERIIGYKISGLYYLSENVRSR